MRFSWDTQPRNGKESSCWVSMSKRGLLEHHWTSVAKDNHGCYLIEMVGVHPLYRDGKINQILLSSGS